MTEHKHTGEGADHPQRPAPIDPEKLLRAYEKSDKRMFFMDYDGTLAPIVSRPEDALPSDELKRTLEKLADDSKNRVYIISGRDRKALGNWLGDLRVGMSTEHGCFLRLLAPTTESNSALPNPTEWKDLVKEEGIDASWKDAVRQVCDKHAAKLSGATVEAKEYAITFHYRQCEKGTTKSVVQELKKELDQLASEHKSLNLLKGKKSYEARIKGITKGTIVKHILEVNKRDVNFIFSAGDDLTDEDMFTVLDGDSKLKEDEVFTVTVNFPGSKASSSVENQKHVIKILSQLAEHSSREQRN